MPVGLDEMSLTRNMPLHSLALTARDVTPGMTVEQVAAIAESHDSEAANSWLKSLFVFEAGGLVEDVWVRTAKAGNLREAEVLAWVAIVWSEPRIAKVVEEVLTDDEGHFDAAGVNTDVVERTLNAAAASDMRKAASTLLNRLAQAHLLVPAKYGGTIVGVERLLPTSGYVPLIVEFVAERVRTQVSPVVAQRGDAVELALLWRANRWLGLSKDEFRRAAAPRATGVAQPNRAAIPTHLALIDQELRRRRQVVLQGAPGVGKTYVAMQYVSWATADQVKDSRLGAILDALPVGERTPARVAEEVAARGLTALWELAQFHPSYGYEDFVRTLAPQPAAGGITFRAEHRALSFLAAVGCALREAGVDCDVVLIVDEINRADIARVFGELLYGLEYRGEPVRTPYTVDGDASMTLPKNLLLIGTMNTADRSIALIDYALRRRFTFIDLAPDRAVITDSKWVGAEDRDGALALFDRVQALFASDGVVSASLAVGHSYFLPSSPAADLDASLRDLARRFSYEVVPLLLEYAAEGLIDLERLNGVLAELGVDLADASQTSVETQVHVWLSAY